MRTPAIVTGFALLSLVTACGGDSEEPAEPAAENGEGTAITQAEFEEEGLIWPLSSDEAELRCEPRQRVIVNVEGTDYPLNHPEAFDDDGPVVAPMLIVDEEGTEERNESATEEQIEERGPVEEWPPMWLSTADLIGAGLELCEEHEEEEDGDED